MWPFSKKKKKKKDKYEIDPKDNAPREVYGVPSFFEKKYDIEPKENIPQKVYGTPKVLDNETKYDVKPEKNVPQRVYGIPDFKKVNNIAPDDLESFEETVKSKISDPFWVTTVVNYFKKELKLTDSVACITFNDIAKYDDILNEFTRYLIQRNYNLKDAIEVEGYSAQKIIELNPSFNASGVYSFMGLLRSDKDKALDIINKGFINKDSNNIN